MPFVVLFYQLFLEISILMAGHLQYTVIIFGPRKTRKMEVLLYIPFHDMNIW